MATFKVTEDFDTDIAALDAAEFNINTNITELTYISTMQTASRYYSQHQAIKALLNLYAALLRKEVSDLRAMAKDARALDEALVVVLNS